MSAIESADKFADLGEHCWNFAYGANMKDDVMRKRRKIYPIESVAARLDGHRLTFNHVGMPFVEPGFGTVEKCADEGACVHGVAHRMRVIDFVRLHRSEGGGQRCEDGYQAVLMPIELYDGRKIEALVFESVGATTLEREAGRILLPSQRYASIVSRRMQ